LHAAEANLARGIDAIAGGLDQIGQTLDGALARLRQSAAEAVVRMEERLQAAVSIIEAVTASLEGLEPSCRPAEDEVGVQANPDDNGRISRLKGFGVPGLDDEEDTEIEPESGNCVRCGALCEPGLSSPAGKPSPVCADCQALDVDEDCRTPPVASPWHDAYKASLAAPSMATGEPGATTAASAGSSEPTPTTRPKKPRGARKRKLAPETGPTQPERLCCPECGAIPALGETTCPFCGAVIGPVRQRGDYSTS
jgi:hypothetical protein